MIGPSFLSLYSNLIINLMMTLSSKDRVFTLYLSWEDSKTSEDKTMQTCFCSMTVQATLRDEST